MPAVVSCIASAARLVWKVSQVDLVADIPVHDLVRARLRGLEHEPVIAWASVDQVIARVGYDHVIAVAGLDRVVTPSFL